MKILNISVAVLLVIGNVFGQDIAHQENAVLDRYYLGIGAQLFSVDSHTISFSGPGNTVYHNEQGQFNDFVMVSRLLPNGPAARAGIEENDIVSEIDGFNAIRMKPSTVIDLITKADHNPIKLRLRRTDTKGVVLKEFALNLIREKIDRVAWIPLDQWIGGTTSGGTEIGKYSVVFESKVREDLKNHSFLYTYRIRNQGRIGVLVRWQIIEQAAFGPPDRFSDDFRTIFIALKPGKIKTFTLKSKAWPTEYLGEVGKVTILINTSSQSLHRLDVNHGFTTKPGNVLSFVSGSTMPAFIPEAWVSEHENH